MDLGNTGKVIAQLRRSAGFTQASLAEKLGITDKAVSKWERGIAFPDTSILNQLCILLDTDIESLMYGHGQEKQWIGVLILNDAIPVETVVYDKPLIHYLISQFLLVGIREIYIVGKCNQITIEGVDIKIRAQLNQRFTKNIFIIYGNHFLYGPNLTKHFMRAMSRDVVTIIAAMKAKGDYPLKIDSNRNAVLSEEWSKNKYYALPYVFDSCEKNISSFNQVLGQRVNVETMVRGMVYFNLNSYENIYQMAGFVKMMEESTGEIIADLDEIIERRKIKVN